MLGKSGKSPSMHCMLKKSPGMLGGVKSAGTVYWCIPVHLKHSRHKNKHVVVGESECRSLCRLSGGSHSNNGNRQLHILTREGR